MINTLAQKYEKWDKFDIEVEEKKLEQNFVIEDYVENVEKSIVNERNEDHEHQRTVKNAAEALKSKVLLNELIIIKFKSILSFSDIS
jgi:hypothetical protein